MTDISQASWVWLAKGAGAVAGSAISIAYILPSHRREAGIRFAVGVISGMIFGGAAGLKIAEELGLSGRLGQAETVLMGSAAASLCAWGAIGLVLRFFQTRPVARATPKIGFPEERNDG